MKLVLASTDWQMQRLKYKSLLSRPGAKQLTQKAKGDFCTIALPAGAFRSFLYKTTLDLLAHLGISRVEELPEYEKVRADIAGFKNHEEN